MHCHGLLEASDVNPNLVKLKKTFPDIIYVKLSLGDFACSDISAIASRGS